MSVLQIHQRLESVLAFMNPYWSFVNCHMVNYLTDNHWLNFVPKDLQKEVPSKEKILKCIDLVFWNQEETSNEEFPLFRDFLKQTEHLRLKNFPELFVKIEDLQKILGKNDQIRNLSIKDFMSEKKNHEVEITSSLINDLIETSSTGWAGKEVFVIDAGDGKGYLSSRLALEYKHKVLGVDANEANTSSAIERNERLKKVWNGLTKRAEMTEAGLETTKKGKLAFSQTRNEGQKTNGNYKTTSKFITTQLNLEEMLKEHFPGMGDKENPFICLTGLHTCGNLASTCLEVFHAQENCKILCNIGCCYHLLKESFSTREFFGNKEKMDLQPTFGFPLSDFLLQKHFSLGRNARMLASQSIERTIASKELPNISLFYRALMEVLICEKDGASKDQVHVGRIRKSKNFKHYVNQCKNKLSGVLDDLEEETIEDLETKYEMDQYYLQLFYLVRMTFAPILETIILLDRLLYLKEKGYEKSFLVPLFDPVISPRHYAIVALKK